MQKKFLENLFFLVFINLVVKPLWVLGVERNVQNVVGEEQYGMYFSLFNLSFILNILLDMGINTYNTKLIASAPENILKTYVQMAYVKLGLACVYAICSAAAAYLLDLDAKWMYLFLFVVCNQILIGLIAFNRSCIIGLHLYKWDSFFSVFDKVLLIVVTLVVLNVSLSSFTVIVFAYLQTICLLLSFVIGLILVWSRKNIKWQPFSWDQTIGILKETAPYALMIFLMSVYYRIDAILLQKTLPDGAKEAGVYAAGYRIYDAISNVLVLFGNILLPFYAKYADDKVMLKQLTKFSYMFICIAVAMTLGVGWYLRTDIIDLLYHRQDPYWINIYFTLLCSLIGVSTVYIYGSLLTASGKIKWINYIVATGVLVNVVSNLILIPKYRALGAAYSFFMTQSLMGLLHFYFGNKYLKRL